MAESLHTVLGASGAIGKSVIKALQDKKLLIRAIERSANKKDSVEIIPANLLIAKEAKKAIMGSSHVYLCVGLPYSAEVWKRDWPVLMQNVIDSCKDAGAKLIYFDNVYMYGPPPLAVPFAENHPQNPITEKGKARKETTDLLLTAISAKKITALVGRSADFYGPDAINSPFYISFLDRMLKDKPPQYLSKPGIRHTYAYCLDNGRALVDLALEQDTYGQVWHLPAGVPVTIEQVLSIFNKELDTNYEISYISSFMRKILAIFAPIIKEVSEMQYQFNDEYIMSFDKFKKRFPDFKVTDYEVGIREMVKSFKSN